LKSVKIIRISYISITWGLWLKLNHIETLVGRVDWEGEIREVKYPRSFVKEMYLSLAHGLRTVREDCNVENTRKTELYTCETPIQKQYEGCSNTA
jgi:hypothetical protein